jgi:putative ABC transport system permease protein
MLFMLSMATHFRIALRTLARRPWLAAGRTLTVTVVVTAVSAVLTVGSATLLRRLPFPHPERLVRINLQPPGTTDARDATPLDPFEFVRIRGRAKTLERIEGIWVSERAVAGDGEPESITAGRVSAGFFALFGGEPVAGRLFTEAEVDGGANLVVLSHGLWTRWFGGEPSAVGRTLLIDREPHTVVGVVRSGFEPGFARSEFWTPLTIAQGAQPTLLTAVQSYGLLAEGAEAGHAQQELGGLLRVMEQEAPALLEGWTVTTVDLREAQFGSRRPAILLLLVAVAAFSLIAIANLANLTLADVIFRQADFALRAALGGSRVDLAAPEAIQCLTVAAAGGGAGLVGAAWLVPFMLTLDPTANLPPMLLKADWRIALCGFGVAVAVMLAAVVVPVLQLAQPGLARCSNGATRRAIGSIRARRAQAALITVQITLAVVLISSAALVGSAVHQMMRIDPGFEGRHVLTAQLRLPATVFPADIDRVTFVDRILERLRATPGVVNAGTTLNPFTAGDGFTTMVHVEDQPSPNGQPYPVQFRRISPGYFETMRIALDRGRVFDRRDWVNTAPVAIVSRSFARRFWPDRDPIGRRIKRGSSARAWSIVVGVVDDVRDSGGDQPPRDTVYSPYFQTNNPAAPVALVVRTEGDPAAMVGSIKRAVWEVDVKQPLGSILTLDQFMVDSLGPHRFRATLIAVFGVLGLLLATIGTYGVTARSVAERTREMGIRLALGGTRRNVWWSVSRVALKAVVAGAIAGSGGSVLAAVALGAALPEARGTDWTLAIAAAGTVAVVGALASVIAARAAASVDPLRAIQSE